MVSSKTPRGVFVSLQIFLNVAKLLLCVVLIRSLFHNFFFPYSCFNVWSTYPNMTTIVNLSQQLALDFELEIGHDDGVLWKYWLANIVVWFEFYKSQKMGKKKNKKRKLFSNWKDITTYFWITTANSHAHICT